MSSNLLSGQERISSTVAPDPELNIWRDVEGEMDNSVVDTCTVEDTNIFNASQLLKRAWITFNITFCVASLMILCNGFSMSRKGTESVPQISIFCLLWFGHVATFTFLFRTLYVCLQPLFFFSQARGIEESRNHTPRKKPFTNMAVVRSLILQTSKMGFALVLASIIEILACFATFDRVSSGAWMYPIDVVVSFGWISTFLFKRIDLAWIFTWKGLATFCITGAVKLSNSPPKTLSWHMTLLPLQFVLCIWTLVMLKYVLQHWLKRISLKVFQLEAALLYIGAFAAATIALTEYAYEWDSNNVSSKADNLVRLHECAVVLTFISACCATLANWLLFAAALRTLLHRRGADRPQALMPNRSLDISIYSFMQSSGAQSWIVDPDRTHVLSWALGEIEPFRSGQSDRSSSDRTYAPGTGHNTYANMDYLDQSESFILYYIRYFLCAHVCFKWEKENSVQEKRCNHELPGMSTVLCWDQMELRSNSNESRESNVSAEATETTPMLRHRD